MSVIRPVYQQGYIVENVNASLKGVAIACERLYLDMRANPDYILFSQTDHDAVYREVAATCEPKEAPDGVKVVPKLTKLVNQITGSLMEVFISDRVPYGTLFFGTLNM